MNVIVYVLSIKKKAAYLFARLPITVGAYRRKKKYISTSTSPAIDNEKSWPLETDMHL